MIQFMDVQGQLNMHNAFKQIVQYIMRETSNGMKMLQCLAKSKLTQNTEMGYSFSLHNFIGLYLVCSAAKYNNLQRVSLDRLHKACKTMNSQIVSCHTQHSATDTLTESFIENAILLKSGLTTLLQFLYGAWQSSLHNM